MIKLLRGDRPLEQLDAALGGLHAVDILQEAREVLLSHAWLTASASSEELGVECATDGRNGRLRCLRLDPQSSGIDNAQTQQKEEKDDRERYSGSVAFAVAESESRKGRLGHADGAEERAQLEKEKHRLLASIS